MGFLTEPITIELPVAQDESGMDHPLAIWHYHGEAADASE
jgi:hypothetical protein